MPLTLRSAAFPNGGQIPPKYTDDGDNVSPPLEWAGAPDATRSYVVVMEDPDAPSGVFRHWALYDIAPNRSKLPEGVDGSAKAETMGRGLNDMGHEHYDGPAPPPDHGVHHYHFRIAALDVDHLPLPAHAPVDQVWKAAQPHMLDLAEIVGTYARGRKGFTSP